MTGNWTDVIAESIALLGQTVSPYVARKQIMKKLILIMGQYGSVMVTALQCLKSPILVQFPLLSERSLHFLPVTTKVSFGSSGFLPYLPKKRSYEEWIMSPNVGAGNMVTLGFPGTRFKNKSSPAVRWAGVQYRYKIKNKSIFSPNAFLVPCQNALE